MKVFEKKEKNFVKCQTNIKEVMREEVKKKRERERERERKRKIKRKRKRKGENIAQQTYPERIWRSGEERQKKKKKKMLKGNVQSASPGELCFLAKFG